MGLSEIKKIGESVNLIYQARNSGIDGGCHDFCLNAFGANITLEEIGAGFQNRYCGKLLGDRLHERRFDICDQAKIKKGITGSALKNYFSDTSMVRRFNGDNELEGRSFGHLIYFLPKDMGPENMGHVIAVFKDVILPKNLRKSFKKNDSLLILDSAKVEPIFVTNYDGLANYTNNQISSECSAYIASLVKLGKH